MTIAQRYLTFDVDVIELSLGKLNFKEKSDRISKKDKKVFKSLNYRNGIYSLYMRILSPKIKNVFSRILIPI